jgi:TfoX/Sxy family transcriptional regulator of competence genes
MAYDEGLAEQIRDLLVGSPGVSEKRMFGGVAFLIGGNMAISASGQGGALVRVDPAESDHLVDTTGAEIAIMRGRPMPGWLRVPLDHSSSEQEIARWVTIGTDYARSLPPKPAR